MKALGHDDRDEVVADDDRHDRRLRLSRVESDGFQCVHEEARVLPQRCAALWLALHDGERGERGACGARRGGGGEDQCPRMVLDVIDHRRVCGDESADRGHRLREGAHHEVHLGLEPEVLGCPPARAAQDPDAVSVVNHHARGEFSRRGHDLGQRSNVSLHREHTVHDDEAPTNPVIVL